MYPTSAFSQPPLGYPYPGQQQPPPPGSIYQSQYGAVGGFNHQVPPPFQPGSQPRGQSLPASGRQYAPTGNFAPPPTSTSSSRRHQHGPYPPPAPSQHYEYRSTQGSKSKKHHKRRSVSPSAVEQGLYSDQEQPRKERTEPTEAPQNRSRSASPALASRSKHEGTTDNSQPQQQQQQQQQSAQTSAQQSQGAEGAPNEPIPAGVARSEEEQAVGDPEKRRSSSKKKRHHRRDRYENYGAPPPPDAAHDVSPNNLFHPQPQSAYFGEYQNELPPQLKVHRQPLYNGYNQAYEESIRRGDVYRKQAKRSTRLPPEVKQQLLPHEDDQQNHSLPITQPPPTQQQYPYGPASGYPPAPPPQQPPASGPPSLQPFGTTRTTYNPYQPYAPPHAQTSYYSTMPASLPFNTLQPWSNVSPISGPAEQEIQRLRSHIHTLEGELHKLQRKLNKATLNNNEAAGGQGDRSQDEGTRSHRRSKRDGIGSPRQTPVIVELNNATGEAIRDSSSKKHRHRTPSNTSAQQGQHSSAQPDVPAAQRTVDSAVVQEKLVSTNAGSEQQANQQAADARDRSRSGGNQIPEADKTAASKQPREEAAAQLAHAAAAHVNNRTGVVAGGPAPPPPPPVQQNLRPQVPNPQQQPPQQQHQQPPPPQQQQQQQQFLFQQGVVQGPGQQIRGPAPRLPGPGNIRFPADPYQQQQQQQQQQRNLPNPNYNQSNNNELFDYMDDDEERRKQDEQSRSAEKILDAFERFYVNRGKATTVPMKVKYIPEDDNIGTKRSHHHYQQRNTNNNNRYRSTSRQTQSNSSSESESDSESIYSHSPSSSRRSLYDNQNQKTTIGPFI